MPCTMSTIRFDRSEENLRLKELGDLLTHELDKIREAVLANETPDFSAYDASWDEILTAANESLRQESSGPSTGVLTDSSLLHRVDLLFVEYVRIKNLWRLNHCKDMHTELRAAQEAHRAEDLKRLAHHFINVGDYDRLRKVIDAETDAPLEPQLGFDPDEF